jgi:hypothetical protein
MTERPYGNGNGQSLRFLWQQPAGPTEESSGLWRSWYRPPLVQEPHSSVVEFEKRVLHHERGVPRWRYTLRISVAQNNGLELTKSAMASGAALAAQPGVGPT